MKPIKFGARVLSYYQFRLGSKKQATVEELDLPPFLCRFPGQNFKLSEKMRRKKVWGGKGGGGFILIITQKKKIFSLMPCRQGGGGAGKEF